MKIKASHQTNYCVAFSYNCVPKFRVLQSGTSNDNWTNLQSYASSPTFTFDFHFHCSTHGGIKYVENETAFYCFWVRIEKTQPYFKSVCSSREVLGTHRFLLSERSLLWRSVKSCACTKTTNPTRLWKKNYRWMQQRSSVYNLLITRSAQIEKVTIVINPAPSEIYSQTYPNSVRSKWRPNALGRRSFSLPCLPRGRQRRTPVMWRSSSNPVDRYRAAPRRCELRRP